ncbi:uncharacterized protein E0L32_008685 [Thyridium curvatum]|uniref:Cyclin-dependent kinase n=1 Tax=Thyridium curvatum TaxID=1093900 RepID=A0A507B154_9PEZI|nr:uncharacterized protein E0L32_008685 [Thyridium curvatum]TPX10280.1 hypothetical protein E0L32_008685 [Thyridium curvatum]
MLPSLRSPRQPSHRADLDARRALSRPADLPAASDANRMRTAAALAPAPRDDSHAHAHAPAAGAFASALKQDQPSPAETDSRPLAANGLPDHQQDSSSTSQDTSTTTTDQADRVFTPPVSEGSMSAGNGNDHDSNQGSQLLKLSQLAAAQEKMPNLDEALAAGSRKRMADGMVKHARNPSSASPTFAGGHSRNTSSVSVASTSGSRIGELSAELKSKLSYAMLKVNHGWQHHSIDQVESLASHAASPTSTTSTIPGRHRSSASPRLSLASPQSSNGSTPPSATTRHFPSHGDHSWRDGPHRTGHAVTAAPSLAPPASIQPSRHALSSRRNSNPRYTPAFLSAAAQNASPRTPGQPHSAQSTPHQRHVPSPMMDPIVFSPHQNVREQDAIESLLFMSSPGNSANMKHTFPTSSSQPLMPTHRQGNGASVTSSPQRTALPGSAPRKSLPSGRPSHQHSASQPATLKRVGFDKSTLGADEMDVDNVYATPRQRAANGGRASFGETTPRPKVSLSTPLGLGGSSRPRPSVGDEEIERMLDRVAAAADDSSDSESEIEIPVRRGPGEQQRETVSM